MEKYFYDFNKIIESIEHDNTYKTAWGSAIIECVLSAEYEDEEEFIVIYEYNLVQKLMKYYWNQIVFFGLSQGPSKLLNRRIEEIRDEFYHDTKVSYPVWYDQVEKYLKRNPVRMERQIKKFITFVNSSIITKFEKIDHEKLDLYTIDVQQKCIRMTARQYESLKKNATILQNVIDFKWAQLLEIYNKSPNLLKKVTGSKSHKMQKPGHKKLRNIIIEHSHFEGIHDFYTGEHLRLNDISLDYLVPYYYAYSTDVWNLVITSKETAKARRGVLPSKEELQKLKKRNKIMLKSLSNTKSQIRYELENAVSNHLLSRYYTDFKG